MPDALEEARLIRPVPVRDVTARGDATVLVRLAHTIARHRLAVIGIWIFLTALGAYSASRVSERWFGGWSVPGPAYDANQRAVETFGTGEVYPMVAVFHSKGEITKIDGIASAIDAAADVTGARVRRPTGRPGAAPTCRRTDIRPSR